MADKAISLEQFKEALKAIRNSTISEPDLSVKFVENAPNWNAAEGQAGHIENRPFKIEYEEILPATDFTFMPIEEMGGMMTAVVMHPITIENDTEYKVLYNGVEYMCRSAFENANYIGNFGAMSGEGDTGEPFLLINAEGTWMLFSLAQEETATMEIYKKTVKTIEIAYIPDLPMMDISGFDFNISPAGETSKSALEIDAETAKRIIREGKKRGSTWLRYNEKIQADGVDTIGVNTTYMLANAYDDASIAFVMQTQYMSRRLIIKVYNGGTVTFVNAN